MRKKNGFSLVEILVASSVFSLVILGLVSVFIAAKGHVIHARERMVSAVIGKFFIDPLQMDVRQENWDTSIFVLGKSPDTQIINNTEFTATYVIADVVDTDLHRVITTITWPDSTL
ncbi:MAG: type II secretion system GspH family protein [Candidatus Omnitrophica bacterium]|nr:type II secretion system GspH family protein [Candidatus Omnitrophota bacterium]MBU4303857.1 type II secretion system GspH family protein [Candidatus Omnitrophota bacterium]